MPVPMITPTPKTVRSRPDRCFFSRCSGSSVSRIESSTDLIRRMPAVTGFLLRTGARRLRVVVLAASHGADGAACLRWVAPGACRARARRWVMPETDTPADLPAPGAPARKDGLAAMRPRPMGAPKPPPSRPAGQDVVVDCAVYVD